MNNRHYVPLDIEFLIYCHYNPAIHPRIDHDPIKVAITKLTTDGLIKQISDSNTFGTTPLGQAHVKQLCNCPLPKRIYADQQGNPL